jgi:hypothetical protein
MDQQVAHLLPVRLLKARHQDRSSPWHAIAGALAALPRMLCQMQLLKKN